MAWGKRDPRRVQAFERGLGTDRVEAERWVALLQGQDAVLAELARWWWGRRSRTSVSGTPTGPGTGWGHNRSPGRHGGSARAPVARRRRRSAQETTPRPTPRILAGQVCPQHLHMRDEVSLDAEVLPPPDPQVSELRVPHPLQRFPTRLGDQHRVRVDA
jgi:hypothetical protein